MSEDQPYKRLTTRNILGRIGPSLGQTTSKAPVVINHDSCQPLFDFGNSSINLR